MEERKPDFVERESERGAVLVVTAMLDDVVKGILETFFIEGSTADSLLSEKGGAIGDYFTRSNVAYVLGLISKTELQRLQIIGELRNQLAHVWHVEQLAQVPTAKTKLDELARLRSEPAPDSKRDDTISPERALFQHEAIKLFAALMSRLENTERRERYP
ncbi:MAG TPA: hypothetical protein VJT80_13510 [Steroidobacteraceae bacterium]|nr:hypothetical protein [Steroidobacteraceae bacterium]